MKLQNFTWILLSLCLIFYILYIAKSIFIPFSIAIVVWYLIIALSSGFEKISIKEKSIPHFFAMILSVSTLFLVAYIFSALVNSNVGKVVELAPFYQERFQNLSNNIMDMAGVDHSLGLKEMFNSINVSSLLKSITGVFTTVAGYASMILIYTLFLLLEYRMVNKKLKYSFKSNRAYERFMSGVSRIDRDIKTYIKIKTSASLATAILSYAVLALVGVDFAVFWSLLIFVLNFIPTVGSIIAVFFPILLSLIQFDSAVPVLVVITSLITIQAIIGNVLEPRFMGKSLNLSPLVIILSLAIWGSIWGVVGMFLCIPIMVILNIILAKFEKTKALAVALSARGKVE